MASTQSTEANLAPLEQAVEVERKLQVQHHVFFAPESHVSHLE